MLKNQLTEDLRTAMRAGDSFRVSVLRMLLSAVSNKEIEILKKDVGLSDEEVVGVISKEFKKRKDAAREFRKGGREELADKEEKESEIILFYLPKEVPDDEIERVVEASIREADAKGPEDFGKVMKLAMAVLKGKASGDRVSESVKSSLGA